MTSGGWAPPGWTPPGWTPPGWTPPGWTPPGWGPPAPEPAGPRPRVVAAAVALWAGALVCSLASTLWTLTHLDDELARVRGQVRGADPASGVDGFVHAVTVAGVFALGWLAAQAVLLVCAWQGRNWARVVLWVLGGLAVFGAAGFVGAPPGRAALLAVQLALTLTAVVLLALPRANGWYRRRGVELVASRRR
ncbi:hypothetical protein [Modestobacter sp. NPDC049651]|uniref:hypothetical protein n=1 Tax=unclassified Modestobacter TaxID=2643866 RepID=UPI0034090612